MTPEQIAEMLVGALMKRISGNRLSYDLCVGTVKEVNEEQGTCVIEREGRPAMHDVRLNAVIDEKIKDCFRIIPSQGSHVLVMCMGEATEGLIVATSKIDKVIIQTGDVVVNVSASGVVMNGGKLGGMIDIAKLTDKVNELVDTFNNHTHTIPSGGITTQGSATAQATTVPVTVPTVESKAKKLSKGDYEDDKVKH